MGKKFEGLEVWKRSMRFSLLIYEITRGFPQKEKYGMTSQIQRAAVSIPANIAEGCGRSSNREFVRFLNISLGSLNEVNTFIYLSKELKYINEKDFYESQKMAQEVGRLLGGFKRSLTNN